MKKLMTPKNKILYLKITQFIKNDDTKNKIYIIIYDYF